MKDFLPREPLEHSRAMRPLHILAIPFPGQGHIDPMLNLATHLVSQSRDVVVTIVNIDSIHRNLQDTWPSSLSDQLRLVAIPFSWSIPKGFDAYCMQNMVSFMEAAENMNVELEKLIADLNPGCKFCCIISDYFLPWTQQVADKFEIPRVALWCGCAAWSSLEFHIDKLVAKNHVPVLDVQQRSFVVDYIPGLSALCPTDIPTYLHTDSEKWIQMIVKRAPVIRQASWVFVDSFSELEPQAFQAMQECLGDRFVPVGPLSLLRSRSYSTSRLTLRPEDSDCLEWLDEQAPASVVYISFGSTAVLSLEEFAQLAEAFETMEQPFLWVIRPGLVVPAPDENGVDQSELRQAAFLQRTKEYGFVTAWSPQLKVLSHAAVGCFVTHCGWNSIQESIACGVPMLGWPWAAEQNFNCKLMAEDWKLGFRFRRAETAFHVKIIGKLIDDTGGEAAEVRARSKKMKEAAKAAVASGGSSFQNLSRFVDELKATSSTD